MSALAEQQFPQMQLLRTFHFYLLSSVFYKLTRLYDSAADCLLLGLASIYDYYCW